MLVQFIAERINENWQESEYHQWIYGDNYDFLYTPQNAENFADILKAQKLSGTHLFDVTEWNGYKVYHSDEIMRNTFYFECPSGNVFFFSVYYKGGRDCYLVFPSDRHFNNW